MKISRIFFYCHNEISLSKERPYCPESQKDRVEQSSEDIQEVGKAWWQEQETENTNSATSWNQMLKYTILWEPFSAEHSDGPAL